MSQAKGMSIVGPCNHKVYFNTSPVKGDEVYCVRCGDFRTVIVAVAEWRTNCEFQSCTFSVRFGDDEHAARRAAIRHVGRYPAHVALLYQGDRLDSRVKSNMDVIPGSLPDRYHTVT